MPLLDPIIEILKPKIDPEFINGKEAPDNIKPILTLLNCLAQPYHNKADTTDYWEITTADGTSYARVSMEALGESEEEWTKLIGMLLDYAATKPKG